MAIRIMMIAVIFPYLHFSCSEVLVVLCSKLVPLTFASLQMPTLPLTTPVEINQEGHRKFVLSPHNRVTTVAPNYKNMIKVIKAQIYILTLYPGSRFCSASLPASPLPPVTMCAPVQLLPSAVSKPEMESWFPGLGSLTGQSGLEPLTRVGASSLG